jgi:charged multivesicular body protein 6
VKVFEGLQRGNEVLKQIHSQMTLEDVEKLMDDTQEAIEYQNVKDSIVFISLNLS